MKELIEFIIKNIVSHPEAVQVSETEKELETVYTVKIADDDFGKIIGRSGKVATAIRTVVKTAAKKSNKRVFIKFEK